MNLPGRSEGESRSAERTAGTPGGASAAGVTGLQGRLSPSMLLLALVCGVLGIGLAQWHPALPVFETMLVVIGVTAGLIWPSAWVLVVPAVVPVLSLTPYTGSFYIEECDLLALGILAGSYAGMARRRPPGLPFHPLHWGALAGVLLLLLTISYVVSAYSGIDWTGPLVARIRSADYSPLNGLRILKGFLLALLALPLLRRELRRHGMARLTWGGALALAATVIAGLWERLSFPGLTDFAADYRITTLFWEMHVGGAALDGALALTLPFAAWHALRAPKIGARVAASVLFAAALYVVLVTFSRALYLGVAIALAIVGWLLVAGSRAPSGERLLPAWASLLIALTLGALCIPMFGSGGYRTLVATGFALGATLLAAALVRRPAAATLAMAAATALALSLLVVVLALLGGKGAYAGLALAALAFVAAFLLVLSSRASWTTAVLLGSVPPAYTAALAVAHYWGGAPALQDAAPIVLIGLGAGLYNLFASRRLWQLATETFFVAGALGMAAAIVAVAVGSYGVNVRFATAGSDIGVRLAHWKRVLDLASGPFDNVAGQGLGRFPRAYMLGPPGGEFPGTFELREAARPAELVLGGPRTAESYNELLRFGQLVSIGRSDLPFTFSAEVRSAGGVDFVAQICQRHLLYAAACVQAEKGIGNTGGEWQPVRMTSTMGRLEPAPWYAPRPVFFAVTNRGAGSVVELRNLRVTTASGRSLLENGDFRDGSAWWFFTSDRAHMPWHAKNLWLGVWFDQGWLGVIPFSGLVLLALVRSRSAVRQGSEWGVPLLAGLVAFLVVGMFDNVVDVPRLAFLFYLFVFAAVLRPGPLREPGATARGRHAVQ